MRISDYNFENACKSKENFQQAIEVARENEREQIDNKIGELRQWLNEERITDPRKMVTNKELKHWFNTN